ncbi:hypothetical protein RYD26_12205 [Pasteurellaceae bacterium LIM206]|nr:hypothetical protein [Pasteurellaceae bacterium LIM206]
MDPLGLQACPQNNSQQPSALPAPTAKNPWMDGTPIESYPVPKGGIEVEMAIALGQPSTKPGGWATTDHIPTVDYVRTQLAVTPEFKPEVSHVQRFLIPEGVQVQSGTVRPQTYNGITYPGDGNQIQILNFSDRAKLLPLGPSKSIK